MNMQELTYRYLHDELSEDEFAQLQRWIEADIANAEAFVRFAGDDVGIVKTLQHNEYGELIFDFARDNDADADEAIDLQQLIEQESQARPIPFSQIDIAEHGSRSADKPLTLKEFKSAASYLVAHSLKTKAAAVAAIAAILVLSLTLFLVLRTTAPASQTPPIVHQTTPATPDQPIVATLTAQQNAHWAERALARGSQLRAGDRLTLTAGFAEITTRRGAVAILEAPATIELLENENALRLHAGKLVGICETESSKGFLVHTTRMDVIDLGTRFGVDVSARGGTTVAVFNGEVEAMPSDDAGRALPAVRVTASMVASVDDPSGTIQLRAMVPNDRVAYAPIFDSATATDQSYQQVVLNDLPHAYWSFEQLSDGAFTDSVTTGLSVSTQGDVTQAPGVVGRSVSIDNSQQWSFIDLAALKTPWKRGDPYSFELWARPRQIDHMCVLYLRPYGGIEFTGDSGPGYIPRRRIRYGLELGGGDVFSPDAYEPGRWYHIVGTCDADGNATLYINGQSVITKLVDLSNPRQPGLSYLGTTGPEAIDSRPFTGEIDEFAVYDYTLTAQQIAEHYRLANERSKQD